MTLWILFKNRSPLKNNLRLHYFFLLNSFNLNNKFSCLISNTVDAISVAINIKFSKFLKKSKTLIFGKAFEIRLTVEKHIRNIKVIVPSLSLPFKSWGRRNLKKIINNIRYVIAKLPTRTNENPSSENMKYPRNPTGSVTKNAIEKKSDILPKGNVFFLRIAKNKNVTPAPNTPPIIDNPGK